MIQFTKSNHKYIEKREGEAEYTSVTTVVKQYKKPFDAKAISEKYALKHPEKTAKQWRAEWKKIGKEASDHGTKVHAELEAKTREDPRCQVAAHSHSDGETIRSLDSLKDLPDGLYPELLIWSDKWKVAGQVDLVEIKEGVVDIVDYKNFKRMDLKSFYNPKIKQWSMMLEPLHGVQDCNYNHAGLQMSLYAMMLEEWGYKVRRLSITHIDRNGNKTPYSVPYSQFKMFVKFMLLDFKKNGSK
jgi:hypothetical protein